MPFRYVKGEDGEPIMPEVRTLELMMSKFLMLTSQLIGNEGVDKKGRRQGGR